MMPFAITLLASIEGIFIVSDKVNLSSFLTMEASCTAILACLVSVH